MNTANPLPLALSLNDIRARLSEAKRLRGDAWNQYYRGRREHWSIEKMDDLANAILQFHTEVGRLTRRLNLNLQNEAAAKRSIRIGE